ncbi:hypothetical protein OF83DRAFT_533395 [Amylostereum chailletii]|nr:hypothetical protein OF83DRAFT_533395 [Amylostereum chailletii]
MNALMSADVQVDWGEQAGCVITDVALRWPHLRDVGLLHKPNKQIVLHRTRIQAYVVNARRGLDYRRPNRYVVLCHACHGSASRDAERALERRAQIMYPRPSPRSRQSSAKLQLVSNVQATPPQT